MGDRLSRISLSLALALVVALLALVSLSFLCAALYLGLASITSAPLAALASALVIASLALALALVARTLARSPPPSARAESPPGEHGVGAELGVAIEDALAARVRSNPVEATAAALIAGLLVGVSPRLRRSLWRLLQ